ncbi:MAG: hypothetical protein OQK56_05910, partial [Ignavibacteriaceae bacterium]|nr:hypothetical protein [Ignavibacteriaceae bacterium]
MKHLNTIQGKLYFILILTLTFAGLNQAQDKKKINKLDDLPRFDYPIDIKASELLVSENEFNALAKEVKKNILNTLNEYEIDDKTTLKGYYFTLRNIYMLDGNYESAVKYNEMALELQEKPADKLMSGIVDISIIEALQNNKSGDNETTRSEFIKNLK